MTSHPYDELEAYALGSLGEAEACEALAHADTCPSCAAVLATAMRAVTELEPNDVRQVTRPLAMPGVAPIRRPTNPVSIWRWLSVAGAVAACLAIVWSINTARLTRESLPVVPIAALVHSHFSHHALRLVRGTTGNAKVIQALDGSWIYVVGDGFPPHARYTLIELTGDETVSVTGGITDADGQLTSFQEQTPRHIDGFTLNVSDPNPLTQGNQLHWP